MLQTVTLKFRSLSIELRKNRKEKKVEYELHFSHMFDERNSSVLLEVFSTRQLLYISIFHTLIVVFVLI